MERVLPFSEERLGRWLAENEKPIDAVPTPLPKWNQNCFDDGGGIGLAHGWYIVIAGSTGHGKTLMGLNLAAHALDHGEKVCYLTLEMSERQLVTRLMGIMTGDNVRKFGKGALYDPEEAICVSREMKNIPLCLNAVPDPNLTTIGHFLQNAAKDGYTYFVIDYLQLIRTADETEIYQRTHKMSQAMLRFSRKYPVVVIGLSQFNRKTSAERKETPIVQGLFGASSLENDSDQVLLLDHSRKNYDTTSKTTRTYALLAKNRYGPTGEIPIELNHTNLRIREALPDELDLWP